MYLFNDLNALRICFNIRFNINLPIELSFEFLKSDLIKIE